MGRRRFLVLGGAGAAVLLGTAGAARALIKAGGPGVTPRSLPPVGLDPAVGREVGAVAPARGGVYHFALAGTDGWVTMPLASDINPAGVAANLGASPIDPYFPDPLADPTNTTTYAFCFRNVTGLTRSQVAAQKGHTQICAPIIYSTVGDELWLTLSNLGLQLRPDLVDGHTLHWHGFRNAIPFYDGVPESSIAVAIDHDFTYVYRPEDSGTYMYHCHFEDVEHVTMGMHGIVFVKPDPATLPAGVKQAYGPADGDTTGDTRYDREFAIMLSEIDTRAHFGDAHIQATDWTDFHADFWTMNGRAYPDTLAPNGWRDTKGDLYAQELVGDVLQPIAREDADGEPNPAGRLFSNPLSSLVQCKPGDRVLIRFANLGFLDHSIVFPGLEVDVLGRDARYVPASEGAQRTATDSIQIGPGESRDVFFTAPQEPADYPFYDRGMSHFTGSADGTDAWVGGQRSAVRVVAGLADQLKPNGWGDEDAWTGEFPIKMTTTNAAPELTATGGRIPSGSNRRTYLTGTVIVDQVNHAGTHLDNLWWVKRNSAPPIGSPLWNRADFTPGNPNSFDITVGNGGTGTQGRYHVVAQDSVGQYSNVAHVTI